MTVLLFVTVSDDILALVLWQVAPFLFSPSRDILLRTPEAIEEVGGMDDIVVAVTG